MPKGQKAMAVAFQYPESEKGGRGKKGQAKTAIASMGGSAPRYEQARAVLRHSRELAQAATRRRE
jgi:hypothetical protein